MANYSIIVGNLGTLAIQLTRNEAYKLYADYCKQSLDPESGRVSGEDVTLISDGEPIKEFRCMVAEIEVTDTFGGEANYSWVNRYTLRHPAGMHKQERMRQIKALIGWTGIRCEVSDYGGTLDIRPRGMCQVCFVTWKD